MSNDINEQLFERAAAMIDYWVGKMPGQVIEEDLKLNDLEALSMHVAQAEAIASQNEFEVNDAF